MKRQGDIANAAVLQEMFGAVRLRFGSVCSAFVHNAGLLAGFSSVSEFAGSPALTRAPVLEDLATVPADQELNECALFPFARRTHLCMEWPEFRAYSQNPWH